MRIVTATPPSYHRQKEDLTENLNSRRLDGFHVEETTAATSNSRANHLAGSNKKKRRAKDIETMSGWHMSDSPNGTCYRKITMIRVVRRSFRAWRRYFPRRLWSPRRIAGAHMRERKRESSRGCRSQHTMSQHRGNTENHGQIPSTAPVRGVQYLSIVFGVLGEPHELRVEIGGERDTGTSRIATAKMCKA